MLASFTRWGEYLMPWSGVMFGLFAPVSINAHRREAFIWGEITAYCAATGLLGIGLWWIFDESPRIGWMWLLCVLAGMTVSIWWYRSGVQAADHLKNHLTKRSCLERVGRTDVRTVAAELPTPREEYDPRQFHRSGEFFMGLDVFGHPIQWEGSLPHTSVTGTSGAGKGRKLQDLAAQSILSDEALFYLDPKDDEWGAHALYSACQEQGVDYYYLRLLPESPHQINLLQGAKSWEVEELFHAALGLSDVGTASDFFRAKDRNAAHEAAMVAVNEKLTIAKLYQRMAGDEYWQEEAPGFLGKLGELAQVDAINAYSGAFTLAEVIANGGGVYVVGSMTLQSVKRAQQMIFVRIQQIATARDRMLGKQRIVCVIADEVKYHISRPVLQGLGASRDKGMRVILAFQSFADLKDCPADLNPDMVVGAILENTPCKIIYRIEDPDTAEWMAKKSGIVLVDDETRQLEKNLALSETAVGERSIRQSEHYLFDTNKLMNFPAGWSIVFGLGVAKACYVSPFTVAKTIEAITPTLAPTSDASEVTPIDIEPIPVTPTKTLSKKLRKKSGGSDDGFFSLE